MRDSNPYQNNGAWFNERTGKITASRMASAMAFLKAKKDEMPREAAERRKLKIEILAERMTGDIVPKYQTAEIAWGIEQEPAAKEAFERKTGLLITDCGFINHPEIENCGCSPDGLVSDGSLIEVKCPSTATMVSWLISSRDSNWLPEDYLPQMILQSACTKKDVWFCAYDPRLPEPQSLIIRKFKPTREQILEVEEAARQFLFEVDELFDLITKES